MIRQYRARSYVLGTRPRQNVLGTSSRYTSIQIASTVKCSQYPFVQISNRYTSRSAQYDLHVHVLCIHCAMCDVILTCTLHADSGLRAKPRPLEHVLGITSFRLRFGGVLRGRFVPRTCFDRVPAGTRLFRTRSDYKKRCVPRTCSENMFPLELYREQVWTPG